MQDELDPQTTPNGEVVANGEVEPEVTSPAPTPDEAAMMRERMEKLEKSYQEAQRLIGRQGQELGELRRRTQPQQGTQQEQPVDPNTFYTDPVGSTKRVLSEALSEFEARQEMRRQAERLLAKAVRDNNTTEETLYELNEAFERAGQDPQARIDLLMEIHRARNASTEIQRAAQATKDTVERNARAVTSERSATQVSPPGKAFDEMTGEEMRAWIKKNHGEVQNW